MQGCPRNTIKNVLFLKFNKLNNNKKSSAYTIANNCISKTRVWLVGLM